MQITKESFRKLGSKLINYFHCPNRLALVSTGSMDVRKRKQSTVTQLDQWHLGMISTIYRTTGVSVHNILA